MAIKSIVEDFVAGNRDREELKLLMDGWSEVLFDDKVMVLGYINKEKLKSASFLARTLNENIKTKERYNETR